MLFRKDQKNLRQNGIDVEGKNNYNAAYILAVAVEALDRSRCVVAPSLTLRIALALKKCGKGV